MKNEKNENSLLTVTQEDIQTEPVDNIVRGKFPAIIIRGENDAMTFPSLLDLKLDLIKAVRQTPSLEEEQERSDNIIIFQSPKNTLPTEE